MVNLIPEWTVWRQCGDRVESDTLILSKFYCKISLEIVSR